MRNPRPPTASGEGEAQDELLTNGLNFPPTPRWRLSANASLTPRARSTRASRASTLDPTVRLGRSRAHTPRPGRPRFSSRSLITARSALSFMSSRPRARVRGSLLRSGVSQGGSLGEPRHRNPQAVRTLNDGFRGGARQFPRPIKPPRTGRALAPPGIAPKRLGVLYRVPLRRWRTLSTDMAARRPVSAPPFMKP